MGTVRSFTASEWLTIPGRGRLAVIAALPESDEVSDPRTFKGWRVRIDSQEYDVIGVETSAVPFGGTHARRSAFGLLVREVPS